MAMMIAIMMSGRRAAALRTQLKRPTGASHQVGQSSTRGASSLGLGLLDLRQWSSSSSSRFGCVSRLAQVANIWP